MPKLTKSEKEMLIALESAFDICFIVKDFAENVVSGCNVEDDITHEIENIKKAGTFIDWYIKTYKK